MSKYFGKGFGPSTRAPKDSDALALLLLLSKCFTIKVNSICGAGRDTWNCVTSSILRVLLSGFWVSGSRFPSPRDPFPVSWVSGSHVSGSWDLRVLGPGSQVLILDYAYSVMIVTITLNVLFFALILYTFQ